VIEYNDGFRTRGVIEYCHGPVMRCRRVWARNALKRFSAVGWIRWLRTMTFRPICSTTSGGRVGIFNMPGNRYGAVALVFDV
jgi:hypothetical protein